MCNNYSISETIKNCSFIDIMGMKCKWQVGYSGTTNINMKIPDVDINPLRKYDTNIIEDCDKYNVDIAMLTNKDIIKFNTNDIISEVISYDFDVIIDACAAFKDYANDIVAEMIFNKNKRPVKYLTKEDVVMLYDGIHSQSTENLDNMVYYFSQRHIVGIDIPNQSTKLKGILLVNDNNTYTQASQAMYRMRKLNKGQTITFGYIGNIDYTISNQIRNALIQTENKVVKNNEPLLYLQYLKYYYRSILDPSSNPYNESSINELFEDKINYPSYSLRELCFNKLNKNINFNRLNSSDPIIGKCIDYIKQLPDAALLKLVYQTNTTVVQVNNVMNMNVNVNVNVNVNIDNLNRLGFNQYIFRNPMICNFTKPISEFDQFNKLIINNNGYKIILSQNNMYPLVNFNKIKYRIILIKLDAKTFIIDNTMNINFYINVYPIYNISGKIINANIFTNRTDKFININELLNFTLYNKMYSAEFNFAELFNITNNIINTSQISDLIFGYCMHMYVSIAYASTTINPTNLVSKFGNLIYKYDSEYFNPFIERSSKKDFTKQYLEYIYSNFSLRNERKLMFNPLYNTDGSQIRKLLKSVPDSDFIRLYLLEIDI